LEADVEKDEAMAGTSREERGAKVGDWRMVEDGARTAKAPAANLRTGTRLIAEEASMILWFCRTEKLRWGERAANKRLRFAFG